MKFWSNVQSLLASRGMTAKELAGAIGVTPAALSRYGRGSVPSLEVAAKISKVLGVSLDSLVWGAEEALSQRYCPAPAEHGLLHELVDEWGLQELVQLSSLGTQSVAWQVADLLTANYPRALDWCEIRDGLPPDVEETTLKASLVALRRRGIIVESGVETARRYALRDPRAQFTAQEMGDLPLHLRRSIRMLLEKIFPALERRDGTAHMLTFVARVPRSIAEKFSHEMNELVKSRAASCLGPGEGDTDVNMAFGVAIAPPS